ncbi:MAG: hypothetical protein GX608_06195 [Lentisphaerae bacterium]|nr:hypothetical protein [Lentisphaerota bacterium]
MIGPVETLENGVTVHQVTDDGAPKSNIYCEFPWCPPDSSGFVFVRRTPGGKWEYVLCRFGTWEKQPLGAGTACTMAGGRFYFRRDSAAGEPELVRADLSSGRMETLDVPPQALAEGGLCLSADERYRVYSRALSFSPQRFGITVVDMRTGQREVVLEDPYLCNTHLQFDRGRDCRVLVQHNRGCRFSPAGRCELLCGSEGCTLFILDIPGGRVVPLQVGPPHTVTCSGHETWLGRSGEVLLTLNLTADYDLGKGPIMAVKPGQAARPVCPPREMNHIGVPDCGRLFCADAFRPDEIIIGSPATGRAAVVCPARASYKRGTPDSHPHAYLSPDLRWVVFNSDRTGAIEIYAASVPAAMAAGLL